MNLHDFPDEVQVRGEDADGLTVLRQRLAVRTAQLALVEGQLSAAVNAAARKRGIDIDGTDWVFDIGNMTFKRKT